MYKMATTKWRWIFGVAFVYVGLFTTCGGQLGPGSGPWDVVSPESEGLNQEWLETAEEEVNRNLGNRTCFLVVKNGKIVFEKYRRGRTVSGTSEMYSHTKSFCASVFGTAVEQGWASPEERIAQRLKNTRQCNRDASFENVLTMTGQSPNLLWPTFMYDADGSQCLDTIQDFVTGNNPDGIDAVAWKNEHWAKPLGMEHMQWGKGGYLHCGYSAQSSCRDAARVGQLFNNNGRWPGFGQLMSEAYTEKARTVIHPFAQESWGPYGYLIWLYMQDDYDPTVSMMSGANAQCTVFSKELNAVIVSFGTDDDSLCDPVWNAARYAVAGRTRKPQGNSTQTKTLKALPRVREQHALSEHDIRSMLLLLKSGEMQLNETETDKVIKRLEFLQKQRKNEADAQVSAAVADEEV
eukprot:m.286268 g.286268  ORF g.286268 m.286268 type:complete len:407 (+) comp19925_c0_seq10:1297-2517(+)